MNKNNIKLAKGLILLCYLLYNMKDLLNFNGGIKNECMDNFSICSLFRCNALYWLSFSKKSNNVGDYFLGGRGMGSWLTALSAQASDMSSWLLMGLPGAVYLSGLGEAWIAVGLGIGTYLNWLLVAKRLRNYSYVTGDAITIPEYFQNRFNAKSTALRVTCAIIIFIFFLVYTASSFNAAAKLYRLFLVFSIRLVF